MPIILIIDHVPHSPNFEDPSFNIYEPITDVPHNHKESPPSDELIIDNANLHFHPESQIIRDVNLGILARSKAATNFCMFVNFVSIIEPKKLTLVLKNVDWIKEMQDEMNEFECHAIWTLFRNNIDEDGIITKNKARLVA